MRAVIFYEVTLAFSVGCAIGCMWHVRSTMPSILLFVGCSLIAWLGRSRAIDRLRPKKRG